MAKEKFRTPAKYMPVFLLSRLNGSFDFLLNASKTPKWQKNSPVHGAGRKRLIKK